jgi:hypothetical protein
MKKFTFLLLIVIVGFSVNAQPFREIYDLNYYGQDVSTSCNPFKNERDSISTDSELFKVSHGSPSFVIPGNDYAVKLKARWDSDDEVYKSEGLYTKIAEAGFSSMTKFKKGDVYQIVLKNYKDINRPISAYIYMAKDIKQIDKDTCIEHVMPSSDNRVEIFRDSLIAFTQQKIISGDKFQPKKDYEQLWIVSKVPYKYEDGDIDVPSVGAFWFKEIEIKNYGKDTEPPDKPSNLQSSDIETNRFTLTWDEPTDNYNGVDYYEVNIDNGDIIKTTAENSITVDVGKSCHNYIAKVRAFDVANNASEYSDTIHVTTRFDEPILDLTLNSGGPLCNNSSKQFSTTEYDDVTYNWTHGSGITLSDENGPSTTATANTTYNGNSYVRVERAFHKSCPGGDATSQKTHPLWIGVPTPDKIEYVNIGPHYPQYSEEICYDYPNDGEVEWTGNGSVTEYEWDAGNWMVEQHPSVPFPQVPMRFVQITAPSWGYDDPVYVTVKAKNSCGWGSNKLPAVVLDAVSCDDFFTLSPNPSNNYVEISPKQNEDQMQTASILNSNETIQVRFINNYGKVVQSTTFTGSSQRINTSVLDEGVYLVEIQINDHVESHRLMVQH